MPDNNYEKDKVVKRDVLCDDRSRYRITEL
jgi:hypothetical protein